MAKSLVQQVEEELARLAQQKRRLEAELSETTDAMDKLFFVKDTLASLPPGMLKQDENDDGLERLAQPTHFERICDCLTQSADAMTIAQIEERTGIAKASISAVLYRTHAEHFVSYDTPMRAKAWGLRKKRIAVEDYPGYAATSLPPWDSLTTQLPDVGPPDSPPPDFSPPPNPTDWETEIPF